MRRTERRLAIETCQSLRGSSGESVLETCAAASRGLLGCAITGAAEHLPNACEGRVAVPQGVSKFLFDGERDMAGAGGGHRPHGLRAHARCHKHAVHALRCQQRRRPRDCGRPPHTGAIMRRAVGQPRVALCGAAAGGGGGGAGGAVGERGGEGCLCVYFRNHPM